MASNRAARAQADFGMTQNRDDSQITQRALQRGREFGAREAEQVHALAEARQLAEEFRDRVEKIIASFQQGLGEAGATHLCDRSLFCISPVSLDDKHIRAVGFSVQRGRYKICVVVKTKGSVTLVGPFHLGKKEGPCRKFAVPANETARHELEAELVDLLHAFFDEAMTT